MMCREQLTQQLVFLLSPRGLCVWPDSPNEPVFGRVGVTPAPPSFFLADSVEPFVLIRPGPAKPHPEHPEILDNPTWTIGLFSVNANDQAGGASVVGGRRTGRGSSQGRGVLEVESFLLDLISASGIGFSRPRATEILDPDFAEIAGVTCIQTYKVGATRVPLEPCYAPVRRLTATGDGNGHVTLNFDLPDFRYDSAGLWIVRAQGSTPPTTPTGGFFVPSAIGRVSYVDSPGHGTWSYAVFIAYDWTADPVLGLGGTDYRFSGFFQQLPTGAPIQGQPYYVYQPATVAGIVT